MRKYGRYNPLSEEQKNRIKQLRKTCSTIQLCEMFGLSKATVNSIIKYGSSNPERKRTKEGFFDWRDFNNSII